MGRGAGRGVAQKNRRCPHLLLSLNLNERQRTSIEYLKQHQFITNREYREINKIGKVVSAEELNIMVEKNILRQVGEGLILKEY